MMLHTGNVVRDVNTSTFAHKLVPLPACSIVAQATTCKDTQAALVTLSSTIGKLIQELKARDERWKAVDNTIIKLHKPNHLTDNINCIVAAGTKFTQEDERGTLFIFPCI